jgi:glycosyltransferase involved in cell wall biosynthesis
MTESTKSPPANPLVSVIIPTYNRRDMVVRAVESALSQSYRPFEIIVIDDGSTDGTGDALRQLDVKYLYQENRGLAAARNVAIRQSRGELIALLDSDDWWIETKLQRCVTYLQEHPAIDVVYTPMLTVDAQGRPMTGHDRDCWEGDLLERIFHHICLRESSAVLRREVCERVGGFTESLPVCVGHDFWLRVAVDHRFGLIPEPLAVRTWTDTSLTRGDRIRGQKYKLQVLKSFYHDGPGQSRLSRESAYKALAKACYSAGKIYLRGGQIDTGLQCLREALEYRPNWPKAYLYYAWALTKRLTDRPKHGDRKAA